MGAVVGVSSKQLSRPTILSMCVYIVERALEMGLVVL